MSETKSKKTYTVEGILKEIKGLDFSTDKISQSITKINMLYQNLFSIVGVKKESFVEVTDLINDSLKDSAWRFWLDSHINLILESTKKNITYHKEQERKYLIKRLDELNIDLHDLEDIIHEIKEFNNSKLDELLGRYKKKCVADENIELISLLYMRITLIICVEVVMRSNKSKCLKLVNKSFIKAFSISNTSDETLSVTTAKNLLKAKPLEKWNDFIMLYAGTDGTIEKLNEDLASEHNFIQEQVEEIKTLEIKLENVIKEKEEALVLAHSNDKKISEFQDEINRLNTRCQYLETKAHQDFVISKKELIRKLNYNLLDYVNNIQQVMPSVDENISSFVIKNLNRIKEYIQSLEEK